MVHVHLQHVWSNVAYHSDAHVCLDFSFTFMSTQFCTVIGEKNECSSGHSAGCTAQSVEGVDLVYKNYFMN